MDVVKNQGQVQSQASSILMMIGRETVPHRGSGAPTAAN